jgi:hypothetical protein
MAVYTTIDDPSEYFHTQLYVGNGSTQSITNDGNSDLQPDLLWIKSRSDASFHAWTDSTRGTSKRIYSNSTAAEESHTDRVTAFNSDGFSLGGSSIVNTNNYNYVAWQWKANGGTTASNTDGTITSTVQADTDAGFSVVTFTGNGSNDATIGHGLGVTPAFIITKNRADAVSWRVWHKDLTSTYVLFINSNNGETSPTSQANGYIKTVGSSTYSVYQGTTDTNGVNGSSDAMVSYCFAEKQGYSKFSKYVGNGTANNGPFVYLGFKPRFIMIKSTTNTGSHVIWDSKRSPFNGMDDYLVAAEADAEGTNGIFTIDAVSNGFKIRNTGANNGLNQSGTKYIYYAFAENPFTTSTGIPTTAR